jgi:SAM-dependent methyltransferase
MSTDASWVGSMAETYDRNLGPALFAPFAEELASRVAATNPRRILELAAGTGIATEALIRKLPEAQVIATDLNAAMVSWGADQVEGATWLQADAQHLDFEDASFDAIVCQFGVMFFPDKAAAFAEMARVLAPGGTVLFAVWDVVELTRFTAALVESLAAIFPEDPPSFIVRIPHGYTDRDQIENDLQAGGLRAHDIERLVLQGHTPSPRILAEGFCLGTPLRFALQERGSLDVLTTAVTDEMTARLGNGPVTGDITAIMVSAQKS